MRNVMKWICLLLLVVNIAYFGWTLDQRTQETVQAHRSALTVPKAVPRLKLISELDQPPVRKLNTSTRQTDTDEDGRSQLLATLPEISTQLPESLIVPMRLATDACFSFGPFAEIVQSERLLEWLRADGVRARLRRENTAAEPGAPRRQLLWVYLAPQADARTTLQELREQGIQDVRVIETGELQNAISLGLFSSQAAVNRRLRELQGKGYQPVVVPYNDEDTVFWVDARIDTAATIDALIDEFHSGLNYLPVQCDKIALPQTNP